MQVICGRVCGRDAAAVTNSAANLFGLFLFASHWCTRRWSGCGVTKGSHWTGFGAVEEITGEREAHTGAAYVTATMDKATTGFKTASFEVTVVCFSSSLVSLWSLITFDL